MQLDGTLCVLTGASGGIGRALAAELARAGARLILAGRDYAALCRLQSELPAGCAAALCAGDLTDPRMRDDLAALAAELDAAVLINLCGGNRFGLLAEQSDDDVRELVAVNLTAPIALTRRMLPHLARRSQAMVVNVGSALGAIGHPGYVLYGATKFGLRGFSEALGRELADGPVRVIHVAPRATRTTMNTPAAAAMNRTLGSTEDPPARVAAHIAQAMRRGARRTAIGWPERLFARVNQVWPGLVDRAIARQLATIKRYAAIAHQEETAP